MLYEVQGAVKQISSRKWSGNQNAESLRRLYFVLESVNSSCEQKSVYGSVAYFKGGERIEKIA